ncbi:unnamed protein product, partial [Boreogadus saida]
NSGQSEPLYPGYTLALGVKSLGCSGWRLGSSLQPHLRQTFLLSSDSRESPLAGMWGPVPVSPPPTSLPFTIRASARQLTWNTHPSPHLSPQPVQLFSSTPVLGTLTVSPSGPSPHSPSPHPSAPQPPSHHPSSAQPRHRPPPPHP